MTCSGNTNFSKTFFHDLLLRINWLSMLLTMLISWDIRNVIKKNFSLYFMFFFEKSRKPNKRNCEHNFTCDVQENQKIISLHHHIKFLFYFFIFLFIVGAVPNTNAHTRALAKWKPHQPICSPLCCATGRTKTYYLLFAHFFTLCF